MGIVQRLTRASTLATIAFRSGWNGMEKLQPKNGVYSRRMEQYFLMQSAYDGDIFLDNQRWRPYLRERDLHEKTMCVINPTQRIADFYAATIYPGYLSDTGYPVVNNTELAIPLVTRNDAIRRAVGQLWSWSNWEENLIDWIRMGATLGDAPVEMVDDTAAGKVYPIIVRPEFITDVEFDERKNVIAYTKSLQVWDKEAEEFFLYTRVIDKERIITYRNNKEFGYNGMPAEYDNPYGFCPLVWVKHRDPGRGILPGKPAVRDWRKIEELNSDYTRLRMYIRKQALTPMLLAAMGDISPPVSEVDGEEIDIEDMMLLAAAADGSVHKLDGNLELASAFDGIRIQMQEIDDDHPELRAEEAMKQMSQVTGPASQDLLANVVRNVKLASKAYDRATKSMHQQLLAIGGMRANEGASGWSDLTEQQKKFLPFDLESRDRGDLDFTIAPRAALPQSEFELAQTRQAKYQAYLAGKNAGIPLVVQFEDEGMEDEDITHILSEQDKERARDLAYQERVLELESKYDIKVQVAKQQKVIPAVNKSNEQNSNKARLAQNNN
jgi:hypothetical protein